MGRLLSRDPKAAQDLGALYAYCSNRPTALVDPSGFDDIRVPLPEGGMDIVDCTPPTSGGKPSTACAMKDAVIRPVYPGCPYPYDDNCKLQGV